MYSQVGMKLTPPEAKLPAIHQAYPSRSFLKPNIFLNLSRKAKFKAWVGKYRMTLAVLPRQRESTPSSRLVREKQSTIPL